MPDWSHTIKRIAHEWLFSDVPEGEFPPVAILPLENPDLHDHEQFTSGLQDVTNFRTVTFGTIRKRRVAIPQKQIWRSGRGDGR